MPDVIINFKIQETGSADTLKSLADIGVVEEAAAQRTREANAAFAEQQKAIKASTSEAEKFNKAVKDIPKSIVGGAAKEVDELRKKIQAGSLQIDAFATSLATARRRLQELDPGSQAFSDLQNEIKGSIIANEALNKSFTSSRAELSAMRQALLDLEEAGLVDTEIFKNLSAETAQLSDRIGDASARVKALASDTLELDAAVSAVQGVTSAFAVFQGVTALAGTESEDLQRALLKVNAAMAILTGLQQLQNTLQKDNILVIVAENALRKISAASTALQAAAESKFTVIRVLATAAQKALNAVMAANPATVVLVAIAALATVLLYFTSRTDDATKAQEELNRAIEATGESAEFQAQIISNQLQNTQRQVGITRAQNASLKALGATQRQIALAEVGALQDEAQALRDQVAAEREFQNEFRDRGGAEEQYTASLRRSVDLRAQLRIKELEITRANLEEEKRIRDNFLADQVAGNEAAVIEAAEGFRKLDAEIQAIEARLRQTLANPDLTANQRLLAELKAGEEIKSARKTLLDGLVKLQRDFNTIISQEEENGIVERAQKAQEELERKRQNAIQELKIIEDNIQKEKEARQRAQEFTFQASLNIAASLNQVVQNTTQTQLNALQKQLDQGIISQEQFQQRSLSIRRRAAQQEKNYSLFSAVLQQSLAILKVLSDQSIPVFLRPLYIAATIAQTAAQIAAISSTPLPAFAKGTKSAPGGWSLISEKGGELVYDKGKWAYHKSPTVLDLDKGARVIPAFDTQKIMNAYQMGVPNFQQTAKEYREFNIDYEKIGRAVGKEIAKLPLQVNRWDEAGYASYQSHLATENAFMNNRYKMPGK